MNISFLSLVVSRWSIFKIRCKYMSFWRGFVGQNDQTCLWRCIFCQNLADSLLAKVKIMRQSGVEVHDRHCAVHVCGGLPDAFVTFTGCGFHKLVN